MLPRFTNSVLQHGYELRIEMSISLKKSIGLLDIQFANNQEYNLSEKSDNYVENN